MAQQVKTNLAVRGAVGLLGWYRRYLGVVLGGSCRFHPTCSEYARQAYLAHGFCKGSVLTIWRLLRCQPLCSGGEDPVPRPGQLGK